MFKFNKKIYGFECDVYGHLNNSNYLQLLEAGRAEALIEMNIPVAYLAELGISIFINRIEIDYIKPLQLEQIATVTTETTAISKVKGTWLQHIYNHNGELCTKAVVTGVFTKKGKPARMDKELLETFKSFITPQK